MRLQTFRNEVCKIEGVTGFTTAEIVAGKNYHRHSNRVALPNNEPNKCTFSMANIDYDYTSFFDMELVAGKPFSEHNENTHEILVNELTCAQLGIQPQDMVNNFLTIDNHTYSVKGVLKDFHQLSLREAIVPAIFFNSQRWFRTVGHYYIKIAPDNRQATIKNIKKLWATIYPEEEYYFSFLDDQFNEAYQSDIQFGKIYLALSALTILIACLGLFALANFSSRTRIKEIGIRKVNGAKISEVMTMLNKDFVKWVILAFSLAAPVAWFAMYKWLGNFAYKTTLSWWIFALAGILALVIALLTVSFQSYKAAVKNPVKALKYE